MSREDYHILTVYCPPDLKLKLDALAKADDRSVSSYVVQLIRKAVKDSEKQ